MSTIQRALEIFKDPSFREAIASESHYQENVERYGMRPMGYFHFVWEAAYEQARYETSAIASMEADGPYGRII